MCPQRQKMKIYVPHVDAKNGGSFSDVTHDSHGIISGVSSDARKTDPKAAAENLQLVTVGDSD